MLSPLPLPRVCTQAGTHQGQGQEGLSGGDTHDMGVVAFFICIGKFITQKRDHSLIHFKNSTNTLIKGGKKSAEKC